MSTASEVRPLVASDKTTPRPYGFYDDDYTPVDEESRQMVLRRKVLKLGGIAVALTCAIAAVVGSVVSFRHQGEATYVLPQNAAAIQAEHLFAGLLADEDAFYFPMSSQNGNDSAGRRFLRALQGKPASANVVDWSYDWKTQAKDGAAIGEYYRAKGMAMADYYRSKFDPTYVAAASGKKENDDAKAAADGPIDATDSATWTYDWKADMDRGMALGQHYKAIGDAINAHYREAFDPSYTPAAGSLEEDAHRLLKSSDKKLKDHKKKELAADMAAQENDASPTGWYDWQADRDRGIAIGMHYKQLGEQIADHYNQQFNPMYDVNKAGYTDKNWDTMWQDYQKRGQEIANYYKSKGATIDKFYQGKYTLEGMASPIGDESIPTEGADGDAVTASNQDESGKDPNEPYVWGLDWEKDHQHAMAIHDDMMKKGLAIGEYYRARYDPTYGSFVSDKANLGSSDSMTGKKNADENKDNAEAPFTPAAHNVDLDFPPWGVDPEADRQHGIAIGNYWKEYGKSIGATYKQRGIELGKYYEDKYRSQFDPTYTTVEDETAIP